MEAECQRQSEEKRGLASSKFAVGFGFHVAWLFVYSLFCQQKGAGLEAQGEGRWARRGGGSPADYESRARWMFSGSLASCPSRETARLAAGTLGRLGSGGDLRLAAGRLEPRGRSSAWGCRAESSVPSLSAERALQVNFRRFESGEDGGQSPKAWVPAGRVPLLRSTEPQKGLRDRSLFPPQPWRVRCRCPGF